GMARLQVAPAQYPDTAQAVRFNTEKQGGSRRPESVARAPSPAGSYVPSDHPARYSSCSGVSLSILMPMDSSFSFATRLSSSSGTRYTRFSSVEWFFTMYSTESA